MSESVDEIIAWHQAGLRRWDRFWAASKLVFTPIALGLIGFYALGGGR